MVLIGIGLVIGAVGGWLAKTYQARAEAVAREKATKLAQRI